MQAQANESARNEVNLLQKLKHPFIINYIDSFMIEGDDFERTCVIMEYADGVDLYKKMKEPENKRLFTEQ